MQDAINKMRLKPTENVRSVNDNNALCMTPFPHPRKRRD